jgi:hypothetical protein
LASSWHSNWRVFDSQSGVESVCAVGDELTVGLGVRRERDWGTVGEMEQSLRKGLIHIVVAAGPNIDVGSAVAVAAADNTDRDIGMSAGQSNLRHYIGSLRIAWRIKMRWRRWEGRGKEVDGRGKKMGRLRELNKEKQTPNVGRRVICLFKGASLEI